MQEEFKQKKWDQISDQSNIVPNLPFEENNNQDLNKLDTVVEDLDKIDNNQDNIAHLDLPDDTVVTYSGGVPVIHSLKDKNLNNNQTNYQNYDSVDDINNIEASLEKEKRTKIYITVFIVVIVLFFSVISAYLYYKNQAEKSLANTALTVNNNNSNLEQDLDQKVLDLPVASTTNNTVEQNETESNINPDLEYLSPYNISKSILNSIKTFYKVDQSYIIITFAEDRTVNLVDIDFDNVYKDLVLDFYKLKSINNFKDIRNDYGDFRYFDTDSHPILISIFDNNNLIIAKDMRLYLQAVEYLQNK